MPTLPLLYPCGDPLIMTGLTIELGLDQVICRVAIVVAILSPIAVLASGLSAARKGSANQITVLALYHWRFAAI